MRVADSSRLLFLEVKMKEELRRLSTRDLVMWNISQLNNEEEVLQLIDKEIFGPNRQVYLRRLYGRYNVLRCQREKKSWGIK
jgi:hypothetical protein